MMESSPSTSSALNYRIVPGKHKDSKIYVKEPFTYVHDRTTKNPIDNQIVLYLKCRSPTCPARAILTDGFLSTAGSKHQHNCNDSESAGMAKITAMEISSKMKMRAELEMTSFHVSKIYIIVIFNLSPTKIFRNISN